jgi:hypothetical protein
MARFQCDISELEEQLRRGVVSGVSSSGTQFPAPPRGSSAWASIDSSFSSRSAPPVAPASPDRSSPPAAAATGPTRSFNTRRPQQQQAGKS